MKTHIFLIRTFILVGQVYYCHFSMGKALTEMDDRYGKICQFRGWFLDLTPTPMRNELMARQCCNEKPVFFSVRVSLLHRFAWYYLYTCAHKVPQILFVNLAWSAKLWYIWASRLDSIWSLRHAGTCLGFWRDLSCIGVACLGTPGDQSTNHAFSTEMLPDAVWSWLAPRGWQMEVCPLRIRISWSFFQVCSLKLLPPSCLDIDEHGSPARGTATMEFNSSSIVVKNNFPTKMHQNTDRGCSAYNEGMKGWREVQMISDVVLGRICCLTVEVGPPSTQPWGVLGWETQAVHHLQCEDIFVTTSTGNPSPIGLE